MDAQDVEPKASIGQGVGFQNANGAVALEAQVEHGKVDPRTHRQDVVCVLFLVFHLAKKTVLGVSVDELAEEGRELGLVDQTLGAHVLGGCFFASSDLLDFCEVPQNDSLIVLGFLFVDRLKRDGAFLADQLLPNPIGSLLGNGIQSLEDAFTRDGCGQVVGEVVVIEVREDVLNRTGIRKVALVDLKHHREVSNVEAVVLQVLAKVGERLDVGLGALGVRVRDKNHGIGSTEHHLPSLLVEGLSRHGEELEFGGKSCNLSVSDRRVVEEEGPVILGREDVQLADIGAVQLAVGRLDVGCLPGEGWTVVHDLCLNLSPGEVNDSQEASRVNRLGEP